MASIKFNPFTNKFDYVGAGGSGVSYIDGEVADSSLLPVTLGSPAIGDVYLAKAGSGVWLINRRPAGLYSRTANNGNLDDWTYLSAFPEVQADSRFRIYNATDATKEVAFDASAIAMGTTRTISVPNKNVTLDDAADPRTPTSHTHPSSAISDSTATGRSVLTAADAAAARSAISAQVAGSYAAASHTHAAGDVTSGVFANSLINFAAPPSIGSTTPSTGAFTTLTANNGTLTASAPVLDLSQTWNASGVTFTGLRFNVTNTASAAASLLADFQVGGTTINYIQRDGFIGNANAGINTRATGSFNRLSLFSQGDTRLLHNNNILLNESNGGYGWVSSGSPTSLGFDTGIFRGGAGIIEQRNGTNAQTFNIYNTFTSATNHERGFLKWDTNNFDIGTEKGSGGGSARNLRLRRDGTTWLTIESSSAQAFNSWVFFGTIFANGGITMTGSGNPLVLGASNHIIEQRSGTNPQEYRLFGTLNGSNFERLSLAAQSSGSFIIDTQKGGTGSARGLELRTDGTARITISSTGGIGFFGAAAAAQPAAVADATDAASTQARLNDLLARLRTIGIIAT